MNELSNKSQTFKGDGEGAPSVTDGEGVGGTHIKPTFRRQGSIESMGEEKNTPAGYWPAEICEHPPER